MSEADDTWKGLPLADLLNHMTIEDLRRLKEIRNVPPGQAIRHRYNLPPRVVEPFLSEDEEREVAAMFERAKKSLEAERKDS